MNKVVKIILSPEAETVYNELKEKAANSKLHRSIFNAIQNKSSLIKLDMHYGEPISKDKIPFTYASKYAVKNLFWVQLPQFWRLVYTLTDGQSNDENSIRT